MQRLTWTLPVLIALQAFAVPVLAEEEESRKHDLEAALVFGLVQPVVLSGGNVELDTRVDHFVLSYSHGWSLNISGSSVVGDAQEQHLAYYLPYSTGLGIGYQITKNFDVRVEPKLHRFDVRVDDPALGMDLVSYRTLTIGAGAYYKVRPFARRDDFLRGFVASTSVRFWPRVWSSLEDDRFEYDNPVTGRREVHRAANIGVANTPLILNVSVGYAFGT